MAQYEQYEGIILAVIQLTLITNYILNALDQINNTFHYSVDDWLHAACVKHTFCCSDQNGN